MPTAIVATRGVLGGLTQAGGKECMTEITLTATENTTSVQVVFAGVRDNAGFPTLTVSAAIKKGGTYYQCLFSGSANGTVGNNALLTSDIVSGLTLTAGDSFTVRTYARAASGSDMWVTQYMNGNLSDGYEQGATLTDKTLSGTVTLAGSGPSGVRGYSPAWVQGTTAAANRCLIIWGDSISIGTGDSISQSGYLAIACERNRVAYVRGGAGGSTSGAGVSLVQTNAQVISLHTNFGDYVAFQYGVNDISSAADYVTLLANAQTFASACKVHKASCKLSISTVLPVVNATNNTIANDAYWNPTTKHTARVTYNSLIRANYVSYGYSSLWDSVGDASGATPGVFRGVENTLGSGTYRSDLITAYGTPPLGDGLHPDRPILTQAAKAWNIQEHMGIAPTWGPELFYGSVPTSGSYIDLAFMNSVQPLANLYDATGLSLVINGVSYPGRVVNKQNSNTLRVFPQAVVKLSNTVTAAIAAVNNITDALGNLSREISLTSANITNSSTVAAPTETLAYSDSFTRANTSLNATPDNASIGGSFLDVLGNSGNISSNQLVLKPGKYFEFQTINSASADVELKFTPSDFTALSTDPFNVQIGVRYLRTGGSPVPGFFLIASRSTFGNGRFELCSGNATGNTVFSAINNDNVPGNYLNTKSYIIRLTLTGSGASKVARKRCYEVDGGGGRTLLVDVSTTNPGSCPDQSGKVVIGVNSNFDGSGSAVDVKVDDFGYYAFDTTAPTVTTRATNGLGNIINVALSDNSYPMAPSENSTGFSVKVNGSARSITSVNNYSDSNVQILLASPVIGGDTVLLSYSPGNVTDSAVPTANALGAFTDQSVTNNALVSGGISVGAITSSSVDLICTAASGGTGPYTYQWYRSTSSGFTPGVGNIISGAISLSYSDTGLSSSTTYYYKLISTDSVSSTVTSAQASATTSSATGATLISGNASVTDVRSNSVFLIISSPSGVVGPYSYQWHRSTTSGFSPSGSTITGGSSASFIDTAVAPTTTYYYKCVQTSVSTAASVTSTEVTATTPPVAQDLGLLKTRILPLLKQSYK